MLIMREQETLTFPAMFGKTVEKHGNNNALSFVGEKPLSYIDVQAKIESVIRHLETLDIQPGDRVAILSTNMPNWGISYLAINFMGAVVVPLLPDFLPGEIENILEHSESRAIFVSANLQEKLDDVKTGILKHRIRIEDFSPVDPKAGEVVFDAAGKPEKEYAVKEDDLVAIIYTSGTTGSSKGVMLTHKNICSNVLACGLMQPVGGKDRFVSILPLSHTLENTVGFALPILNGACVYYLQKPPSPSVLMPALAEVKPTIMLSVPMVIEKIYYQKILPALMGKKLTRTLMGIPVMRKVLHRAAGKKLMKTFGGEVRFFGIGGATLKGQGGEFLIVGGCPIAIACGYS